MELHGRVGAAGQCEISRKTLLFSPSAHLLSAANARKRLCRDALRIRSSEKSHLLGYLTSSVCKI